MLQTAKRFCFDAYPATSSFFPFDQFRPGVLTAIVVIVTHGLRPSSVYQLLAPLLSLFMLLTRPRAVFLGKVSFHGNPSDGKVMRKIFVPLYISVSPTLGSRSPLYRLISLFTDLKRVTSILIRLLFKPFWLIMSKNSWDAANTWSTSKLPRTGHGMAQAGEVEARQNKSAIWRSLYSARHRSWLLDCKFL